MILTRAVRRAQGQAAEDRFRAWLDRCTLPHIYVDQAPISMPQPLRGEIKRPDFLVGVPTIGTIAVDVKAKRVYADTLIIDAYEHRTLLNFETFFNITVWFACFPPAEANTLPPVSQSRSGRTADENGEGRAGHPRAPSPDQTRRRTPRLHGGAAGRDQFEVTPEYWAR